MSSKLVGRPHLATGGDSCIDRLTESSDDSFFTIEVVQWLGTYKSAFW